MRQNFLEKRARYHNATGLIAEEVKAASGERFR